MIVALLIVLADSMGGPEILLRWQKEVVDRDGSRESIHAKLLSLMFDVCMRHLFLSNTRCGVRKKLSA